MRGELPTPSCFSGGREKKKKKKKRPSSSRPICHAHQGNHSPALAQTSAAHPPQPLHHSAHIIKWTNMYKHPDGYKHSLSHTLMEGGSVVQWAARWYSFFPGYPPTPTGRSRLGRPRTRWMDYKSHLVLETPQEELGGLAERRGMTGTPWSAGCCWGRVPAAAAD
ncbi:unnamed protein product [Pleuronectes platessa]|uniref:Uncharacterized protein n=1 Tax=Pleuronectes platessa TaxID=8262 RepID=A0A9N7V318_PLEPL|nr:unnamed protein product [Pleuronectes platessa]